MSLARSTVSLSGSDSSHSGLQQACCDISFAIFGCGYIDCNVLSKPLAVSVPIQLGYNLLSDIFR